MKKIFVFTLVMALLFASAAFAGTGFPRTLAGVTLGQDVQEYSRLCDLKLASPMPDAPFMSEVHLDPDSIPGIRGGSLTFGNCAAPGKLLRIKLKFHDRSQGLFKKLLEKYQNTYGKPDSYEGDAFRNVIAWQWNFINGDQKVTLLLMWSREKEMRPGVSIKMTYASMVDTEYECFNAQFDAIEKSKGGPSRIKRLDDFIAK